MIVTHYQYSAESMLDNKSFEEGALYFIQDTQHIYLDPIGGSKRIRIANDINILSSETDREGLLAPIPGRMYFVLETSRYYIFWGNTWYASGGSTKPRAGLIYINPSTSLPDGFLWCDGAAYKRSDYSELFAAIGTHYGSGDGSTTFNVPDLTTRVPIGAGGNYKLGQTGGDEEDTIVITNQSGTTNTIDTSTHLYTVVNYIISTGKDSETLSVSDIIASMQILPLSIEYGGTGADNAESALNNLGGVTKTYVDNSISNTNTNMSSYIDTNIANTKSALTDYINNKIGDIDTGVNEEYVSSAIQNANTSMTQYVDQKFASIESGVDEEFVNNAIREATNGMIVDIPTLQKHFSTEKMILSNLQYGTELPDTGVEGQVFFKIIT